MKKMLIVLFASIMSVGIVSAQSGRFDRGRQDAGYGVNEKQSAIRQVNRAFDYKIAAVKMNRRLNRWEKSRQVSQLERQRDSEIARVQFRYEKNSHFYGDKGYADNKKHQW